MSAKLTMFMSLCERAVESSEVPSRPIADRMPTVMTSKASMISMRVKPLRLIIGVPWAEE